MAATPQTVRQEPDGGRSNLQDLAKRHLWMHFTRMSVFSSSRDAPTQKEANALR
jgi:hypothetical protein